MSHMWYSDNRKIIWFMIFAINMVKTALILPDEVKNFNLLINSFLPVKVYLHGTPSPLPKSSFPSDYTLLSALFQNCRMLQGHSGAIFSTDT